MHFLNIFLKHLCILRNTIWEILAHLFSFSVNTLSRVCLHILNQWCSNFGVCQNLLEGLTKLDFFEPHPQFLIQ